MTTSPSFIITHHDDAGEWHDSPVLRSLVTFTVVVTDRDGYVYEGEVTAVGDDGTISLTNSDSNTAWRDISLRLANITTIHYC